MTTNCPQCGIKITPEAPHGLCPGCLLDAALDEPGSAPTIGGASASRALAGMRVRYIGDYELLGEVARGGMGVIYKARQVGLNRTVALKMIRSGELASEDDVRRFHLEAEAAANLQHPNIVAIHEVGVHEGHHYFTMDFVEGQNLAQVAAGKPVGAMRAAGYGKIIAEAIHFAHQRGTLHRDLKPQNVLIDEADRVRITDFGLARQTGAESHLTVSGAVMGSPSYMPPEQARGRLDLTGPASDVYGIGAILYELLTGRPPFRAENAGATLMKVIEQDPVAPSKIDPAVPRDIETICLKCLEKNMERRYPTARALAEELGRFLAGEPIQARPVSLMRKALGWSRRYRWILVAAVSAIFLALGGLVYGLWERTQFLQWVIAHPGWVRRAGPLTAMIREGLAGTLPVFLLAPLIFALQYHLKRSRGLSWRQLRDAAHYPPTRPLAPAWTGGFLAAGLLGCGLSLWVATRYIEAFVWEGFFSSPRNFEAWAVCFLSAMLVVTVAREQVMGALLPGRAAEPPPELPPGSPIREALFAGRVPQAVHDYSAETGLDPAAAKRAVLQLAARLYRDQPDRFVRNPLLAPPVDSWRLLAAVLAAGPVLAVLVGLTVPAGLRVPWTLVLLGNLAVGVALGWVRSIRRIWQRGACVSSAMVLQAVTIIGVAGRYPHSLSLIPILLGSVVGVLLTLWARRRD